MGDRKVLVYRWDGKVAPSIVALGGKQPVNGIWLCRDPLPWPQEWLQAVPPPWPEELLSLLQSGTAGSVFSTSGKRSKLRLQFGLSVDN